MTSRARDRIEDEALLVARDWTPAGPGQWRHPRCAWPWPLGMAATLEREESTPLSQRLDPWRSVRGKSAAEMLAASRAMRTRPPRRQRRA